jgi:hypothetical protein
MIIRQRLINILESWIQGYAASIKRADLFLTATANGRVGFVSLDDIVDVALSALLDQKSHNTDHYIVGPQLLSCTEVCFVLFFFAAISVLILHQAAGILSQVLGRPIKHKALPPDAYRAKLIERFSIPPLLANVMVGLNGQIAAGEDSRRYHFEKAIIGKRFISDWFEENKAAFTA